MLKMNRKNVNIITSKNVNELANTSKLLFYKLCDFKYVCVNLLS